jgi:hypothetical protein
MSNAATVSVSILLVTLASVAGCGGDSVNGCPVVGTWLEDPGLLKPRPGAPVLATTGAVRRQVVFDRNGSFRLTVCDPDGRPVEPAEWVVGEWRIRGGALVPRVKEVRLGPEHGGWVPASFLQIQHGAGPVPDTLDFRGQDGVRVRYRRLAPAGP